MAINSHTVDDLVAAGRYSEAARTASETGDHARAAELFERIWEFAAAAKSASAAGDLTRALRNAIDSRDEPLIRALTESLVATGEAGARDAIDVFSQRRRFGEAARLAEEAGDRDHAIELYRSGHLDLDAARLLSDAGKDREAGRLLERLVEHADPSPELAEAQLLLGTILTRRMQHEGAVRHLQEAARAERTRGAARKLLIVELAALGLRDAARDVLVEARADDPELPIALEEYLRDARPAADTAAQADDTEMVGGRYRLERLLGAGGSGRVYLARDEVSGKQIALKLFNTTYARGHQAYERFVREARIASRLSHPNLVEVYSFSADQGFLVMEYMIGGSLADRIETGMRSTAVRRMILDVLGGLELAHQRGIIHRDVKPANIFFDARGAAKLGDFGVAHLLDLGQTQTGGLIGTLAYMAPEQITGARLTIAADLYGLGVTLFEALTGRLPFLGPDFVAEHLGVVPPAPSAVANGLAEGWDPIVLALLAKNPSDRYESVDALRKDVAGVDLGDDARPRPLLLPRATGRPRASSEVPIESAESPSESGGDAAEVGERYQFETWIGETEISKLSRALDTALDRSVIIERFDPDQLDHVTERRLFALARGSGPYVQRALSYDRTARVAVYEAPAGQPIADTADSLPAQPRRIVRIAKSLALGVAPLHEAGAAHGALTNSAIVLDEHLNPTVLASGLGPARADAKPAYDVQALLAILARIVPCDPSPDAFLSALAPTLSHPEKAAILAQGSPTTGEQLYSFADAVEIAMLKAERRGRRDRLA